MRRREFITLIGGGLASWSTRTYAQQIPAPLHRIGILAQDVQPGLLEAFRDELHKLGYIDGTNTSIKLRNAAGENERLPGLADELLGLKVGGDRRRQYAGRTGGRESHPNSSHC